MSPAEIGRALARIEAGMERIETSVANHGTEIALLKQTRSGATWAINGLWALLLILVEWMLHGKS